MRLLHTTLLLFFLALYALVKVPGGLMMLKPWLPDLYGMGDLYRFSYLGEYRDSSFHCAPPPPEQTSNTSLFVLGDSFAGPFSKEYYPGLRNFSFVNWNQFPGSVVKIATGSRNKNLLVVECSEKHILLRFSPKEVKRFMAGKTSGREPGFEVKEKGDGFLARLEKIAGRPMVTDQNIHMLLFSNEAVLQIKEAKAAFNRIVFHKIAPEVEEFPEKNMLLQRMTTDTDYLYMSAFRALTPKREDETVLGMKALVEHFKRAGVDSVAFAFIPNPVSVIAPDYKGRSYNQLIPRLEARIPETGAGCISVFSEFSHLKEKVYRRGDTHWNSKGEIIWLKKANQWISSAGI